MKRKVGNFFSFEIINIHFYVCSVYVCTILLYYNVLYVLFTFTKCMYRKNSILYLICLIYSTYILYTLLNVLNIFIHYAFTLSMFLLMCLMLKDQFDFVKFKILFLVYLQLSFYDFSSISFIIMVFRIEDRLLMSTIVIGCGAYLTQIRMSPRDNFSSLFTNKNVSAINHVDEINLKRFLF